MAVFLDERCVAGLLTMEDALAAVEEVFREQGRGGAVNVPRVRAPLKGGVLRITAGVLLYRGLYGVKVSSTAVFGRGAGRMFSLYREESGELCAIVQVFGLGALRTGAASGVATKFLANADARVLGVLGSGRQAKTQVEAVCRVRRIAEVKVFSPTPAHRDGFCREIGRAHGVKAVPVESPEAAVRESDVVVSATTSSEPVVRGAWLAAGAHVNAVGANYEHRRELDTAAVAAASFIAADDPEQARYEATDLVEPVREGALAWERVHRLADVVAGNLTGRASATDITLYKSLGVAIEDVALAARACEKALAQKAGVELPDLAG
ncbi:MAG: ornithine cyclodeaminase family protein [Betaproteobacteria bacterium]|nr:ornithine cyclodeaminase family protein [Betaproteobacteria bacterium]MBI2508824.1 ornithine cyclodeaminase family protein [Betaproteobacteria bacterium]